MYNKLFSKIVDSSIWLEPTPTRLIWVMFIAIMDEDGFVSIASPANVAHKARLGLQETEEALKVLESPDPNSANPEHDGRRIERVDGGWMVLNAELYRSMVTREIAKEQVRLRVARHRAKKRNETQGNAPVTDSNETVTPSDTEAVSNTESDKKKEKKEETLRWSSEKGWELSEEVKSEWSEAYPACNVALQLLRMEQWLKANPSEAKKSNWRRFVTNWLKREQDRGGDARSERKFNNGSPPQGSRMSLNEQYQSVCDEMDVLYGSGKKNTPRYSELRERQSELKSMGARKI